MREMERKVCGKDRGLDLLPLSTSPVLQIPDSKVAIVAASQASSGQPPALVPHPPASRPSLHRGLAPSCSCPSSGVCLLDAVIYLLAVACTPAKAMSAFCHGHPLEL